MATAVQPGPRLALSERRKDQFRVQWNGLEALGSRNKALLARTLNVDPTHLYTYLRGEAPVAVFKAIHVAAGLTPPDATTLVAKRHRSPAFPTAEIWELVAQFDAQYPDYAIPLDDGGVLRADTSTARAQPAPQVYAPPTATPAAPDLDEIPLTAPQPTVITEAGFPAQKFDFDGIEVLAMVIAKLRAEKQELTTKVAQMDILLAEKDKELDRHEQTITDQAQTLTEFEGLLNDVMNERQHIPALSDDAVTRITALAESVQQREVRPEIKAAFRTMLEEVRAFPKSTGHHA